MSGVEFDQVYLSFLCMFFSIYLHGEKIKQALVLLKGRVKYYCTDLVRKGGNNLKTLLYKALLLVKAVFNDFGALRVCLPSL